MGLISQFDSALTHIVKLLPSGVAPYMNLLSLIGEPIVTISVMLAIALYAVAQHSTRLFIAASVAGATFATNSLLKLLIHRPRPGTYDPTDVLLPTYSFPSGHAASSVVAFGLLAYLLYRTLPEPWGLIALVALTVLVFGIGVSRVYLGAHYPSDVIGGWIVGGIGLAIIIWIVRPL